MVNNESNIILFPLSMHDEMNAKEIGAVLIDFLFEIGLATGKYG